MARHRTRAPALARGPASPTCRQWSIHRVPWLTSIQIANLPSAPRPGAASCFKGPAKIWSGRTLRTWRQQRRQRQSSTTVLAWRPRQILKGQTLAPHLDLPVWPAMGGRSGRARARTPREKKLPRSPRVGFSAQCRGACMVMRFGHVGGPRFAVYVRTSTSIAQACRTERRTQPCSKAFVCSVAANAA